MLQGQAKGYNMDCKNLCGKELIGRQKEFCSDNCRMQYKRAIKPEQNTKVEQPKVEQMKPEQQTRTSTFTDACGNVHQVDYEGRRTNAKLLETWSSGKGIRQGLGQLAIQYSQANGFRDTAGKLSCQGILDNCPGWQELQS